MVPLRHISAFSTPKIQTKKILNSRICLIPAHPTPSIVMRLHLLRKGITSVVASPIARRAILVIELTGTFPLSLVDMVVGRLGTWLSTVNIYCDIAAMSYFAITPMSLQRTIIPVCSTALHKMPPHLLAPDRMWYRHHRHHHLTTTGMFHV